MYKHVKETSKNLGVAQLVARYLGVVEAASSSLVTQTKMGLFFPAFGVEQAHFSPLTTCLTTYGDF